MQSPLSDCITLSMSLAWRHALLPETHDNHLRSLVSVDFFNVPTVRFQVLYVFLVLAHDRRRILHIGVTACPTAEWTAPVCGCAVPPRRRRKHPWRGCRRSQPISRRRRIGATRSVPRSGLVLP